MNKLLLLVIISVALIVFVNYKSKNISIVNNDPKCIKIDPSPSKHITSFLLFNEYPSATELQCPIPPTT